MGESIHFRILGLKPHFSMQVKWKPDVLRIFQFSDLRNWLKDLLVFQDFKKYAKKKNSACKKNSNQLNS